MQRERFVEERDAMNESFSGERTSDEIQQYWTKANFHGPTPLPTLEIRAEEMWRKS